MCLRLLQQRAKNASATAAFSWQAQPSKLSFSNTSLQHSSPTILHNTLLQHFIATFFCETLVSNTSLHPISPTLLHTLPSNTSLQHSSASFFQNFSTTLLGHLTNTSLQHSSPTLLCKILPQHFSTTLFSNTSLRHFSVKHLSPTRPYITFPQHFSNNTLMQHFSTTLFCIMCPILLYNTFGTFDQYFSTTPLSNTSLQHCSAAFLQHFLTTLYHTLLHHFSTTLYSNMSPEHFFTRLLPQHFSITRP